MGIWSMATRVIVAGDDQAARVVGDRTSTMRPGWWSVTGRRVEAARAGGEGQGGKAKIAVSVARRVLIVSSRMSRITREMLRVCPHKGECGDTVFFPWFLRVLLRARHGHGPKRRGPGWDADARLLYLAASGERCLA